MATVAGGVEADMVDLGALVGSVRRFGLAGPPYEILGTSAPAASGEAMMRIHLLESDEDADYPVADILNDPTDD